MPIAQPPASTAIPTRIASRINPLTVIPPLVHASQETGAYDRLTSRAYAGGSPDESEYPSTPQPPPLPHAAGRDAVDDRAFEYCPDSACLEPRRQPDAGCDAGADRRDASRRPPRPAARRHPAHAAGQRLRRARV